MIHANRLGGEPIGEYETFVRNLPFYTRLKQVPITDDTGAMTFLKSTERVFLVLQQTRSRAAEDDVQHDPLNDDRPGDVLEYRRRAPSNAARATARAGSGTVVSISNR